MGVGLSQECCIYLIEEIGTGLGKSTVWGNMGIILLSGIYIS